MEGLGGDSMDKKISINQVEQFTGVSKRNIRFYESEGLLNPERDDTNGYRKYGEDDVRRIQMIKMFRMLDMPLEEIKAIFEKEMTLEQAVIKQQERLVEKTKELQDAISFCDQLKSKQIEHLDVEECLREMEQPGKKSFFTDWIEDYKVIKEANEDREFSFIPDTPIRNAREFTTALFDFAEKEKLNLVLTKESMYPEFTIGGVEYTAERVYFNHPDVAIPVAMVLCRTKDREIMGENIESGRKKLLWFLQKYWLIPIYAVINVIVIGVWIAKQVTFEEWVVGLGLLIVIWLRLYWNYFFHYNEKV